MQQIPKMPYTYTWHWRVGDLTLTSILVKAWIEPNPVQHPEAAHPDWSVSHIEIDGLMFARTMQGDAGLTGTSAVLPETDPNHERIFMALFTPRHTEAINARWAKWVANPPDAVARIAAPAQAVAP